MTITSQNKVAWRCDYHSMSCLILLSVGFVLVVSSELFYNTFLLFQSSGNGSAQFKDVTQRTPGRTRLRKFLSLCCPTHRDKISSSLHSADWSAFKIAAASEKLGARAVRKGQKLTR